MSFEVSTGDVHADESDIATCDATHRHPDYPNITHRCDKPAGHRNGSDPADRWPMLHHCRSCGDWI